MQVRQTPMTSEEYLALSPGWDERVEYVDGVLVAVSGGTPRHAAVGTNVLVGFAVALRGSGCRVTNADQRVHVEATDSYMYPDVQIICGPYRVSGDGLSVTNPVVVVEVLSPSTRSHDLVVKLSHYRQVPSIQHIVYVDPDAPHIMVYDRTPLGWLLRDVRDGDLVLGEVVRLPMDQVYADLDVIGG